MRCREWPSAVPMPMMRHRRTECAISGVSTCSSGSLPGARFHVPSSGYVALSALVGLQPGHSFHACCHATRFVISQLQRGKQALGV